jgi:hypothetical protein
MNGSAIADVAGIRQAVARPGTRAGLIAASVAWVITRIPMYLAAIGAVHVPLQKRLQGDVVIYQRWLPLLTHGRFPVTDPAWQYPPGTSVVLALPHLLGGTYVKSFLGVEVLCDLAITVLLAHMAIKRGSWLGCWVWLAGIALLGPVVLGHFDIAVTLLAVAALYAADSAWGLGAFAGLGAVIKVWPPVVLVGVRPGQASRAVAAAVATAGVVTAGYLVFTHGSLSFLGNEDSRGIEIESIAAQPFLILHKLGLWHGRIAYQYGSLQVVGPGVHIAAIVMLASTVLAVVALACWRWRMAWRPEVLGDAALVTILLLVATSRVISVQYMIWLVGMAACALVYQRTSQRTVALLVMASAGFTLLEWAFLLKTDRGTGVAAAIGIALLSVRDVLLVVAALLGFARLWRSTQRQQRHGRTPAGPPGVRDS